MASLGIGLGAFVDGFRQGYGIRQDQQDRDRRNTLEDEQLQWTREDRAYQTKERERQQGSRDAMDAVNADARETFDEGVAAGKYQEKDFDSFWTEFALPKMQKQLLLDGDTDGASALADWGATEGAKKGGRLFAGALIKAQTGDVAGALDDALEAAKVQGYMDHGFEIAGKEEIKDSSGTTVGYRVTLKDENGNEMEQDLALDDVADAIASFANPGAAWASQQAAKADQGKRNTELSDYEKKKQIDARYDSGGKGAKSRSDAIKSIRDRDNDYDDDRPKFDDMAPDEQERQIQQELDLQGGNRTPAVPTPNVVVDGNTGTQVNGLGGVPAGSPQAPGIKRPAAYSAPTPNATADPALNLPTPAKIVEQAAQMMVDNRDPNEIAAMLKGSGVNPEYWPEGLTNKIAMGDTARSSPAPM